MLQLLPGYWDTILIALAALIVWTLGNYYHRKALKVIAVVVCGLALLLYVAEKLLYG